MAVITTSANQSDTVHFENVVKKSNLAKGTRVKADKGYDSRSNRKYLIENGLKDGILYKAVNNKPLKNTQMRFNKMVSKTRYKVERTFAGISRWFGGGIAKYVGKAKMHTQHLMEAMAYNLYRSPGIVMSNAYLLAK